MVGCGRASRDYVLIEWRPHTCLLSARCTLLCATRSPPRLVVGIQSLCWRRAFVLLCCRRRACAPLSPREFAHARCCCRCRHTTCITNAHAADCVWILRPARLCALCWCTQCCVCARPALGPAIVESSAPRWILDESERVDSSFTTRGKSRFLSARTDAAAAAMVARINSRSRRHTHSRQTRAFFLVCHCFRFPPLRHPLPTHSPAGLAPSIPEDLYYIIKKAVNVRRHLERNRKDKDSKFRLILVESRIHRLARYYKTRRQLPAVWKYEAATASTLVA